MINDVIGSGPPVPPHNHINYHNRPQEAARRRETDQYGVEDQQVAANSLNVQEPTLTRRQAHTGYTTYAFTQLINIRALSPLSNINQ